jgi:diguanylate cyclase (GGDEF)-like protein
MHRVLVVDDDASIRGVVAEVLRDDGHTVVEAGSGDEALAQCGTDGFDLVLTDIRMPGMDGISLLERLRTRYPSAHVVIMTSHASLDTAIGALKRGAYDYLSKPFESLDIISEVAKRALHNVQLVRERESLIATLSRNNRELEKLNRFLRELSIRDGLTSLYNHRHLHEQLHLEVERARRYQRELSLVFIDVDHFKQYNDAHGHQNGDHLLRSIAEILRANVRETDVVARWGGEEFVIVAPETHPAEGVGLAEKLRRLVEEFPFPGRETMPGGRVTISVGVAALAPGITQDTLVQRADQAVYRAKESGRNTVCLAQ